MQQQKQQQQPAILARSDDTKIAIYINGGVWAVVRSFFVIAVFAGASASVRGVWRYVVAT